MSNSIEGITDPSPDVAPVPYRLSVFPFPPGHFVVHAFRGREEMSKPFVFDITVTAGALVGEDLERLALGKRAAFFISFDGVTRVVPGLIAAVRSEGLRPGHAVAQYRMRLVPGLYRLSRRRRSRIFQDVRADEAVEAVLHEAGVNTRWQLVRKYPKRAYCTQYEETDLAFVERLLAEAGIFYYFAPPLAGFESLLAGVLAAVPGAVGEALSFAAGAAESIYPLETLVLTDDPTCYGSLQTGSAVSAIEALAQRAGLSASVSVGPITAVTPSPSLYFREALGMSEARIDKITAFTVERQVRSNVAEYRDFDPDRPVAPIVARDGGGPAGVAGMGGALSAAVNAVTGGKDLLDLDFSAGPSLAATLGEAAMSAVSAVVDHEGLETYDHHGRFLFPDWADAADEAGRILRERRRRAVTAEGTSLCHALTPGHRFHLHDHPIGPFNREWAVTAVRHAGKTASQDETYRASFDCVPATVAFPPRRKRRRTVQAALTATVAGPGQEEIHVDASGRIKVLFHWDRRGVNDERASCWIRVMQPWGGAGWGHQFIPRIGMEVVIAFDGGDPDKPIVIGSLYNGTHPPAFPLPDQKTRSGLRTQTTPRGGGFNELSFDDAAGKEQVYLRAQRDLDEVVLHAHTLQVGADETVRVGGLRKDEVVEDVHEAVGGSKEVQVAGDHSTQIQGSRLDTVERNADLLVQGARKGRVEGPDDLEIGGVATHRFRTDRVTRVEGNDTVIVGRNEAKRAFTLRVEGTTTLSSEDGLVLQCPAGITLACGNSVMHIGPGGLELRGDSVRVAGKKGDLLVSDGGVQMKTEGVFIKAGQKLFMQTDQSTLFVGSEIRLDAPQVLVNSADRAKDEPAKPPPEPTEIELRDDKGRPLPGQLFFIELEDGTQRTGVTGADGKCKLDLPGDGVIRFANLAKVEPA